MKVADFVAEVQRLFSTGVASEHSYRAALGALFDSIATDVKSVNEPTQGKSGRPDFVFLREQADNTQITVGHCEAKDIGLDISPRGLSGANKEQFERYRKALPNLIYTNCTDWRFYRNGELIDEIVIVDFAKGLQPRPERYEALRNRLKDFAAERLQTITSAEKLAQMMAGKALLTKDVLLNTLRADEDLRSDLASQFKAFKDQLIHDLDIEQFADIYAETIAYGMFAARLHDETKSTFSREEALALLPKSNPFLRNLFGFVAGPNLDESLRRTIEELAEIFQATDLEKLFANFGSFTQRNDPFIHFYETFLAAYNPAKRKARGVWYTPEPVVNFIVRAVDDVLKDEFGLKDGLADTSKVTVDWDTGFEKKGKPVIERREVHRVQILDPAAGTGTFLAEVIKQIAPRVKQTGGATWNRYVEENLIPRLHGFELLMASYAMCHMKLDMMLSEMGYVPTKEAPRLNVYLTNTLEEGEREPKDLFMARWLSDEAQKANEVKNNTPIMCVIGNPPYSGESANKSDWIMGLMEAYKKEPGGKERLNERNPKWINDDYVKFIRFAEHMIEKTGEGVLGFITNHGYLDNPTFRGMRWHLLKTFDRIWILDLHGSAQKKEVAPEAPPDKPVFQIMPGVSILIAARTAKRDSHASNPIGCKVLRRDLFGSTKSKFDSLREDSFLNGDEAVIEIKAPRYYLRDWQYDLEPQWEKGFSIGSLMPVHSNGIVTGSDEKLISQDKDSFLDRFPAASDQDASSFTQHLSYRPFEKHYIWNDPSLVGRNRSDVMRHYSVESVD